MIESLDEMLEYVLNNTKLKFVWLDMKSDKDDMAKVIPIQQEYLQRAAAMGRDLKFLSGFQHRIK